MKPILTNEMQLATLDKLKKAAEVNGWLDKQDILCLFNISSRTLQTWRSEGIIPVERHGGKIFYPASGVLQMMRTKKNDYGATG